MTPSTDEKLKVVEGLIERLRWARDVDPTAFPERRDYEVLKSIASELRARREGVPGVAEVALERRMAAVRASRTDLGYGNGQLVGLAQELVGRWETVVQALQVFEEWVSSKETSRAALNRWRYAFRWWQADSLDVGGEMMARFNWAAGEDLGSRDLTDNEFAAIGHEFLRATGRNTVKGKVVNDG